MIQNVGKMVRRSLREPLKAYAPNTYCKIRLRRARSANFEPELALLSALCDKTRPALDVGAASGIYAMNMAGAASRVVAFEPRPSAAADLRMIAQTLGLKIDVVEVALSDNARTEVMRIPMQEMGRSTVEAMNPLEGAPRAEIETVQVQLVTLDSFGMTDAGMVKVDVEGHEMSVLRGGKETIENARPNVLIEVEERHRTGSVQSVRDYFAERDYLGYFLLDGQLLSMSSFSDDLQDYEKWSARRGQPRTTYINNFIFLPTERDAETRQKIEACLRG